MSVLQIRKELHKFIDIADDRMVTVMHAMMQQYLNTDESIVAYTTSGEPLTKADFIADVEEAYQKAKAGEFITTEDLLKEIDEW